MTSPMSPPPLDLDQVAALLAALRPAWTGQGLIVRPFTWRDARAPWPGPLHTDRSKVTDPESVGLRLTAADGREARLVIWRGGWADVDLLAGGTVITRNPDLEIMRHCVALPWDSKTRSVALLMCADRGLAGVLPGWSGWRRAGWKVHSCAGVPSVVSGCLWTVRGRDLDCCRSPSAVTPVAAACACVSLLY